MTYAILIQHCIFFLKIREFKSMVPIPVLHLFRKNGIEILSLIDLGSSQIYSLKKLNSVQRKVVIYSLQ